MLEKTTKITIEGKCKVDGAEIKGFRAIIDTDDQCKIKFYHWEINEEVCKEHRKTVRADQAEFEDYAYQIQEDALAALETK